MSQRRNQSDRAATIWFTGLPGAGKTTLALRLEQEIRNQGFGVEVLDGDCVRKVLSEGLGYSRQDRDRNVRKIGFVSNLLSRNGVFALASAIAPYRDTRRMVRSMHEAGRYIEVYVRCPVAVLMERDSQGRYLKATHGDIPGFTGISDPYEVPDDPEIVVHTDRETEDQCHERIFAWLCKFGYLSDRPALRPIWTPLDTHGITALLEEETSRYIM